MRLAILPLALALAWCHRPPKGVVWSSRAAESFLDATVADTGDVILVTPAKGAEGEERAIAIDARGRTRWSSRAYHAILLGDPIVAIADSDDVDHAYGINPTTGAVIGQISLPKIRGAAWVRGAGSIFSIGGEPRPSDSSSEFAASVSRFDLRSGKRLWRSFDARHAPYASDDHFPLLLPARAVFQPGRLLLPCRKSSEDIEPDLCAYSLDDGRMAVALPGPVADAASGKGGLAFVLRWNDVSALAPDGSVRWRASLPPGWTGKQLAASADRIAVFMDAVKSRENWRDRLVMLDASDGRELWHVDDDGAHGEHFSTPMSLGEDRFVFVANTSPQLRVVDRDGHLVAGSSLETGAVVSPDVTGAFVESPRGMLVSGHRLLLAPGHLELRQLP